MADQGDWARMDLVAAGIGFVEHLRLRASRLERCEHVQAYERAGLVKWAHRALLEICRNLSTKKGGTGEMGAMLGGTGEMGAMRWALSRVARPSTAHAPRVGRGQSLDRAWSATWALTLRWGC